MSYHARSEQGHHGVKGALSGFKGAAGGHLSAVGAKDGGFPVGTKLQPGTNFTQNVTILSIGLIGKPSRVLSLSFLN